MNNDLAISLLLAAFMGALMLLLPHISPYRYFFAITVPPGFPSSDAGRRSLRRYNATVVCCVAVAVVAIRELDTRAPQFMPVAAMLGPFILGMVAFLRERALVGKQVPPADSVREAELGSQDDRLPRWISLALPPFAFPLAAAAYLRSHWDQIPARFPIHWDTLNHANRWAAKTPRAVYGSLLFAGGLMLVMVLLTLAMFYGSRRGRQRTAIVKMMVATLYFLGILFGGIGIMPAAPFSPSFLLVGSLVFPVLLLVWVVKVLRNPRMPVETTPDECWYLGSIYVNSHDPAVFVQRRIGFGYTMNMGNRLAWLIMGGFVAALLGLAFTLPR